MALDTIVYRNIAEGYPSDVARIGDNLKRLRQAAQLTQEALAKVAGLKQGDISKWEKNKATPTTANLLRLAVGLKLPVDDLLTAMDPDYDSARQGLSYAREKSDRVTYPDSGSGVQGTLETQVGGTLDVGSVASRVHDLTFAVLTASARFESLAAQCRQFRDELDAVVGGAGSETPHAAGRSAGPLHGDRAGRRPRAQGPRRRKA